MANELFVLQGPPGPTGLPGPNGERGERVGNASRLTIDSFRMTYNK